MMMVSLSSQTLLLLTSTLVVLVVVTGQFIIKDPSFSRDDFPSNFVFGAGSSAYQIEGAVAEDGRTPSIWDKFTHDGYMPDHSTADIASDGYHKYKEDVKIMSDIGLEAYRFSISWSRLIPYGRGAINPKGLEYYNSLINELVTHGIEPHVTLYHLDHPQILEDEYGGWVSPRMIEDFTAFADVCFREFGDRVLHWTTVNEPNVMCLGSYDTGQIPPRRCSQPGGIFNCSAGNSSVEPYIAMHNILLAHSSVVTIYREKYQAKQKGLIGINVYAFHYTPLTNSSADAAATQRATDFFTGWVVNPLVFGDYPKIMKKNAGSRIPSFTKRQSEILKGSFDFIGLNHYFEVYIQDNSQNSPKSGPGDFNSDMNIKLSVTKEEMPPGPFIPTSIPYNPSSMQKILEYFRDYYGNPPIYIHENGYGAPYNETLNDTGRIHYINGYLESMLEAIRSGSNTRGYFLWSFLDVFELLSGYDMRYGLVHVDFENKDLKREPKLSAQWYSNFLKKNAKVIKIEDKEFEYK
ncbi:Beta-glucosidase [Thalictrum thalictroides]|uniref:Beta-glucosidase n=1 Tax=Thalictrum thalictroides TaxID=46969 RepID=A0A7J6V6T7_THATH|nr:Beta-glucosidase [Thalictrum thalictroides]